MKACFILTALVACLNADDTAGQVQVADVIVAGNRNVATDRIMSLIKFRPGQYSREELKQLFRKTPKGSLTP